MHPIPSLKDVMTPFPHFIEAGASIEEARQMMQTHGIRHLPVKKDGRLLGVVTGRDIEVSSLRADDGGLSLEQLCDQQPLVVGLHTPLDEVVSEMSRRKVNCVLVTRDDKLAGILTTSDVCRIHAELLKKLAPPRDEPA